VADSPALRAKRHRRHATGDHSLCKHPAAAARITLARPPEPDADFDTHAEMVALARRLTAAHEAAPDRADVARELRATLQAVADAEPPAEDPMDELRKMASRVS
jgi:hypothetical protein